MITSSKPLFSQHYLERRIQACPEWSEDVRHALAQLRTLHTGKQEILPALNEAQTEAEFIQPVLEILGFSYIVQTPVRKGGQVQRPDYALFADEKTKNEAYRFQKNDEPAFYARTVAVADAKYWGRSLSEVSRNDARDAFKNSNPSFQIASYLTGTGAEWGILTNGRIWRLYCRHSAAPVQEYYEVDLVNLLSAGDGEGFKYFWCFFRREAFVKDARGKNFLERVREGSAKYARVIEGELKKLVFNQVFSSFAGGFVAYGSARGENLTDETSRRRVYLATLSFLYKILFLLYAEARNLLPVDGDYRNYSLGKMLREMAELIDRQQRLSQTSASFYDRLLNLFQIIDRGDAGLGVPRYNGGLFKFDVAPSASNSLSQEGRGGENNWFLLHHKLTDAVLAPALDKLARIDGEPVDYGFIDVRHLGAIYEGLLEYRLVIDDAARGEVHLATDKGERKATGSYYTPEYIVKYIIKHTLEPILASRAERFKELMRQISQVRQQLGDGRRNSGSTGTLQKELQRLERQAWETLLDIKVCDPAMGSGHFLVTAVDFITTELIRILSEYPEDNPVLEQLAKIREGIIANLQEQGISIHPSRLRDDNLLHRAVMKRCIYGVDLNPMAVELAKLSLWLHSFTVGAPLSFLDHHLRCGNSLIGATAREAESSMAVDASGQLNLFSGPFVGLLRAAEIMRGISVLSDATFGEVETSERLFREFDRQAKPYKQLLDIYVSRNFGVRGADSFLRRYGALAINASSERMSEADAAVVSSARRLYEEKRFFHWYLEFPEVFIDLQTASWKENPGFDAVVGNPPYVRVQTVKQADALAANYFSNVYETASGSYDLYMLVAERCQFLVNPRGMVGLILPNKLLTASYGQKFRDRVARQKSLWELVDFTYGQVFDEVTTYTCLLFLSGSPCEVTRYFKLEVPEDILEGELPFRKALTVSLTDKPWTFTELNVSQIFEKVSQYSIPLCQLAERLFQGIRTSANEVYILKGVTEANSELEGFSTSLQQRVRVERDLCAAFVAGEEIQRYEISWNSAVAIIPYKATETKVELISLNKLREEYPKTYQYLLANEGILKAREKSRLAQTDKWHGFIYPKNLEVIRAPKILSRDIISRAAYTLDSDGSVTFVTGYGITLPADCPDSLNYVLALLNSSFGDCALKQLNTFVRGGYTRIFSQYLEPIPIRRIDFSTPPDERTGYLEIAKSACESCLTGGEGTAILELVREHLSQGRTDVVHDLLAYLAGEMIELNKQKQAEMKGFLVWLEREIGTGTDSLTNKTRVQNYLGDYQKDESPLSFDELLEILKKNRKRLSADVSARGFQERLQREYQASLDKLLPVRARLAGTDSLIDEIVCRLYGLTDEEIATVGGR
ncbi:MAG: Eco57I restriction-modification methylase domain-containing protein [Oscillatoria princeps RMCB-10]|jgi:hypothetical protein|nr:Eco57I restriction-modification methylase domain-containing protein [Oscillatoria princeps RMCB-10]